ncbi:MAG: hypothetical protein Cons2KO_17250 [Congregibacter sp.]
MHWFMRRPSRWHRIVALFLSVVLVGCAGDRERVQQQRTATPVDMSGNWELDYGRSDNLQARFNGMMRDLRQRAARAANADGGRGAGVAVGGSAESLVGLAQMAELVTEAQLLEIEQSRVAIKVEREGNFSLSCDYGPDAPKQNDYGIGRENCFWDGSQLVFQIRLPEGLDIVHRLSVSPAKDTLAIVSSLYSSSVSAPFTVRRIYRRFEPGSSGYNCTETLTRGRVCTTGAK